MSSQHNKLVFMANQIAMYFRSYPHDQAVDGVVNHIHKFWSPSMRNALRTEAAAHPEGIDKIVLEAVDVLFKDKPEPSAA